jgi:NAD-dependent deacetylase
LWRTYRAEDLATPSAFARNPRLVWEWYDWRRMVIAGCAPNAAHHVLARWHAGDGFTLITQNVDGLHERAMAQPVRLKPGTTRPSDVASGSRRTSDRVIRMHGSIWQLRCAEGCGATWEDLSTPLDPLPPRCPGCGGLARPGVVWFGESLDPAVLARCDAAADCELFLSIGTSSIVYPAAGLVHAAMRRGAFTVEINPSATDASASVDLAIAMGAEEALPAIDNILNPA